MKIKWGLVIIDRLENDTTEKWVKAIGEADPIFFRTVRDCFDYLGFKLIRSRSGYGGSDSRFGYCLTKYRA